MYYTARRISREVFVSIYTWNLQIPMSNRIVPPSLEDVSLAYRDSERES